MEMMEERVREKEMPAQAGVPKEWERRWQDTPFEGLMAGNFGQQTQHTHPYKA